MLLPDRRLDIGDLLDDGQLEHRLGVVRHGTVGVDGDRHRSHAQKAEGDQPERKDGRSDHEHAEPQGADPVGGPHEGHDDDPEPVGTEVAGRQP